MGIIYHLGSSGAGKTTGIQNRIIKEAEADLDRSFLFIVPEQFTLQTQREILQKSSRGGMFNIDALSFNRLCFQVFDEQGITLPKVLEDTGKSMIVKKMLLEHQDELTIYRSKVKKQGFVEEMKSLIAEFYQYRIDRDRFEKMKEMAGDRRILASKLHDIEIIYDAFAKFIDGRFIMNEEVIDRMCDIAGESKLLKDAVIVLDGFTGFTPSQYNCINTLMKYCADIHVVLSIGKKEAERVADGDLNSEGSLFELSIKTIEKLDKLATANNIPSSFEFYDDEKGRYKNNPSLAHLEKNLFRYPYSVSEDASSVELFSAANMEEEADFITAKIKELVFEQGMRYEDIAVLAGDITAYGGIFERKFIGSGIPVFVDEKHSIAGKNAVEFIDAVLDTELSDYTYESVFRLLKTGLCGIEEENIHKTENYIIAHGIKGIRRWNREWKYKDAFLPEINSVREQTLSILSGFRDCEKKEPTVTERLTQLYGILDNCGIELKLYETAQKLKESPDPKQRIKGMELGQVFKAIVTVFERINSLLGPEKMALREFKDVLKTGFAEAKLKSIPGGADSIVVGDIERTRIDNKKVIFLAGCNDSVIPKNASKEGLLNEYDRELFADHEIELSPTKRDNAALSEFYLYLALTKPSKKLFITYARISGEEKESRPAYIFTSIMRLYKDLKIKRMSDCEKDNVYRILGSDKGLSFLIGQARNTESSTLDKRIYEFLQKELYGENSRLMKLVEDALKGKRKPGGLTREEAESLYGKVIIGSITRLQTFAECAFSYFAKYGLGLEERAEYQMGSLELGNIYHKALELYAKGIKKDKLKWVDVSSEERNAREQAAIEQALSSYDDIINSTKRLEYYKKSILRVVDRTIDIVTRQIAMGEFDVGYVEQGFKHENTLMSLSGIIDRLDIVKKKGKTYVRVVDYKTGKTVFDLELVKAGLQLQLAIYMTEAVALLKEQGEDPEPAGMYYYHIDDPVLDAEENETELEKKRIRSLKLDGLTVNEDGIIGLHDRTLISEDGSRLPEKSDIIKYECNKDLSISSNSEKWVIPKEDFQDIQNIANKKAEKIAEDILSGRVDIDPYEYKGSGPCKYCAYINVCGFDRKLGDRVRKI
ncbi:MAG: PD-(D/E)XK nuclease family protein [Lachnospiraceae bacterium]|nr:PD-(D/E)XK nuclease family protein [Lachnospiraceae bacterium]